jgi:hypothetical protein
MTNTTVVPEQQAAVAVESINTQKNEQPVTDERDLLINQLQSELTTLRAREAVSTSRQVNEATGKPVGNGTMEAARLRAIDAAGGNAHWHALSPDKRAGILGCTDTNVPDEELRKYFGSTSDANAASYLAKTSPAKYRSLRILSRERGIL